MGNRADIKTNSPRKQAGSLYLLNLGCAKNLVESEFLLWRLKKDGWKMTSVPAKAEVIIINTCAFITPAIEESIEEILLLAENKKKGACKKLIVAGCLPQRFQKEISKSMPEADYFVGTGAFHKIPEIINIKKRNKNIFPDPNKSPFPKHNQKRIIQNKKSVYIKIAEGCNRKCSYCIIPELKGKYRSRPFADIISEAQALIKKGAKEISLIAQETTLYGKDLKNAPDFSELLKIISEKVFSYSKDITIRVLYTHPASLNKKIIKTVAQTKNIASYFDLPIQHASDKILKKMKRGYNAEKLYETINVIKNYDPNAVLRTSIIVGFPNETEKDFKLLYDFIKKVKFDHLGAFMYSDAEDIPSNKFKRRVSKEIAEKRYKTLMKKQAEISYNKNQKRIGKIYKVLIEKKEEKNIFTGRAWFQAPEVDGIVYVNAGNKISMDNKLKIEEGEIVSVKIEDAAEYDLFGTPI
ncbi:MAG: 30S ribosomal protein S12 methylthiotransferase RimO [Deltaproteobacteria bacterium]|nr:30S ribosomal protein S12 methylthiotransferase RimO [Deltaproteobacteria bacterium]